MEWINVNKNLPDCWSQHRYDYGSGYVLVFTKYGEVEISQLWDIKQPDGSRKQHWEGAEDDFSIITHWMPLPKPPVETK